MKSYLGLTFLFLIVEAVFAEPPEITSIEPGFWAVGVDSSRQRSVSVTFNQRMREGFWDWLGLDVLSPPSNLQTTISPDAMTFTLDVRLAPGKAYIMALNERGIPGVGFQNERGISLAPKFLVFQTAGSSKPQDAPPRALSTFPGNASQDVNPATTRGITVSFDRAMQTKKHGLHLFEEKKPVDLKGVAFTYSPDGKTFTFNYSLKPSTHYEVVMNSTEDIGFAATNRVPLWPVRFAFATGQPH